MKNARSAREADLDALLDLDRNDPVRGKRAELLKARIRSGEVIVVEADDRVAGYVVINRQSFFGRDFVEVLRVAEVQRRQGIGSQLLGAAVGESLTDRLFASTNESNVAMVALLKKAAWQISGRLEGIDDGDPELVSFKDTSTGNELDSLAR